MEEEIKIFEPSVGVVCVEQLGIICEASGCRISFEFIRQ